MAENEPPDIRIGDAERDSALSALGEHLSAGRLDVDEYGERSARVTTARTRRELHALFADLPEPHPVFGATVAVPKTTAREPELARQSPSPVVQRVAAALVPLAGVVSLALFFWLHAWIVFLLPAAVTLLSGAILGDDPRASRRRQRGRARRGDDDRRGDE